MGTVDVVDAEDGTLVDAKEVVIMVDETVDDEAMVVVGVSV